MKDVTLMIFRCLRGNEVPIGFMGMECEHRYAIIDRTFDVACGMLLKKVFGGVSV